MARFTIVRRRYGPRSRIVARVRRQHLGVGALDQVVGIDVPAPDTAAKRRSGSYRSRSRWIPSGSHRSSSPTRAPLPPAPTHPSLAVTQYGRPVRNGCDTRREKIDYEQGGSGSWVERLSTALGRALGPTVGYGFRGLWLGVDANSDSEWHAAGTWTRTTSSQPFDVCPFGDGFSSSAGAGAILTWRKPAGVTVNGFDLYWFNQAGAGNWQYSVDNSAWTNMNQSLGPHDNKLHKFYVPKPVHLNVRIRAYDGTTVCVAPIGGIGVYADDPRTSHGVVVHNLGRDENFLNVFVRTSSGDPLAWLDAVVSNPPSLTVQPALVITMFSNDVLITDANTWQANLRQLIDRVHPYADVLLINPYEQSGRDPVTQSTFRSTTATVAASQHCGLLDLYDAWSVAGDTGWAAANADGLMYDGLHPSQPGHNDIAARVWRLLRTFS